MAGGILLVRLSLSLPNMAESSKVIPPATQKQIAQKLEDGAQVTSSAQLNKAVEGQPPEGRDEIVRTTDAAAHRSFQVALVVPILTALLGWLTSFRMMRLPAPRPSGAAAEALPA